ncbi:caspase-8-like isoform X1, partial [Clarias magur]
MTPVNLNKLHEIDEELTVSEVAALKFLCMNHLGRKRLESVNDAKDLFLRLSEQALFDNELFLPDLLYTIARYDLLPILDTNRAEVSRLLKNRSSGVSVYRKMLYKLSEDITTENLRNIKFLLDGLPRAKLVSATFLDVLAEMEKMEMLGEDNLDELENVLSKCSKELADKVRKFKNTSGTRERDRMEIQNQEENRILSIPCQEEIRSLPLPLQEELRSQPNMSIAETHSFSIETGSLSGSEMMVDTDSQPRPPSEPAPTNAINTDECYPMTQRPVGHCLIINNYNFEDTSRLFNRRGTDADKDALTEVFEKMHFSVEERRDCSCSEMLKVVKEFSVKDHSKMDAFVCCILSHGEKGTVLGTDGKPVPIRELTLPFAHCSNLTGKPKLFFIQACQGNDLQEGVLRHDGTEEDEYEHDAEKADIIRLPVEADFLIGMATVESYKSFRHTKNGSIYIQELCKYLTLGCP